jgi:hypothetical protein
MLLLGVLFCILSIADKIKKVKGYQKNKENSAGGR